MQWKENDCLSPSDQRLILKILIRLSNHACRQMKQCTFKILKIPAFFQCLEFPAKPAKTKFNKEPIKFLALNN